MEYKIKEGTGSNYQITLDVTGEELASHKEKALKSFQKEMKEDGFRKGKVPLKIVEEKVDKKYLEVAMYEQAIHEGTKEMLEENEDVKFIGNIYDLNREEKDGNYTFTYKLDIYPEVEVKDEKWKDLSMEKVDSEPTEDEIEETLQNLSKQYASYEVAEEVTEDAVFKVKFVHENKKGEEVDSGSAFIGKEEFQEFPKIKEMFIGKKANDTVEQNYTEDGMPPVFYNRKDDKATKTVFTVGDVKTVTYPEFTPENIKKFFGNDDVTTKEQLVEKVKDLIRKQKEEGLLVQSVDKMIESAGDTLQVTIPKTLIEEEVKSRMESLKERMGGEDGMKQYFEKIGEDKKKQMFNEIRTAAKTSLEKFFILKKLTHLLGLEEEVNWKEPLNVEKTLYEKLAK